MQTRKSRAQKLMLTLAVDIVVHLRFYSLNVTGLPRLPSDASQRRISWPAAPESFCGLGLAAKAAKAQRAAA